jgi:succinoglycan biosynthesis protein ExoM
MNAASPARTKTPPAVAVDVCICTFRRPQVEDAIRSVAEQVLPPHVRVRLVIADNTAEGASRDIVARTARGVVADVQYIHAPGANISIARNACLDYAKGDWVAFLDDDEVASPGWLAGLLAKSASADVVFGPVKAIYGDHAPAWARAGDFHSARVVYRHGRIDTGYAGNVLMRRRTLEAAGVRFDLALGVTGGEDTMFFGRLAAMGLRLAEAPEALAAEPVPDQRATLGWLARRFWRSGHSHAAMVLAISGSAVSPAKALASSAKAGACAAAAVATVWFTPWWRRWLLRGLMHGGMALRYLGGAAENAQITPNKTVPK